MLTAALTPLSYLIINYVFAKYVVKDYEIPGRFFVIPAIIMFGMTILYYCLLPYIIVRYAIVLAGILLLGIYQEEFKAGF